MSEQSIWTRSRRIFPWPPLLPGEGKLGWGLIFMCAAAALFHFVMGMFLAFPLVAAATILLVNGLGRARADDKPKSRAAAGMALMLIGVAAVSVATFAAASLSYKLAVQIHMPQFAAKNFQPVTLQNFALLFCTSALPLVLISSGLELCTNWSPRRQRNWMIIFAATPFAALIIHQILTIMGGPLTT